MRPLNSVFVTESSELCNIHQITVKVNCEANIFNGDAGWITWKFIIFIFNFLNIYIRVVKQSGNKTTNYLDRLFVFQPDCMINR